MPALFYSCWAATLTLDFKDLQFHVTCKDFIFQGPKLKVLWDLRDGCPFSPTICTLEFVACWVSVLRFVGHDT